MRIRHSRFGAVVLLSILSLSAASGRVTATVGAEETRTIEGAWLMRITATHCETGAQLGVFSSIYTFAQGGTLTNTTNGATPAARSPGLGTWDKTGSHTFKAVSMAFLFNTAGAWTGTQRITSTFEIAEDSDDVAGSVSVAISNTTGALIATMCATAVGERFEP